MSTQQSKYILVNISIPILLHENGTYDQYPDHIQITYVPIESLPVAATDKTCFQLNLDDYFVKNPATEKVEENMTPDLPTPTMVSPISDILSTVVERKYLEITNRKKAKIHKTNTTFRNCGFAKKREGFTKKAWKYLCEIDE